VKRCICYDNVGPSVFVTFVGNGFKRYRNVLYIMPLNDISIVFEAKFQNPEFRG